MSYDAHYEATFVDHPDYWDSVIESVADNIEVVIDDLLSRPDGAGLITSIRDYLDQPFREDLFLPARYYFNEFNLPGDSLRQATRKSGLAHVASRLLNNKNKGYYYPHVHRRWPDMVPPERPQES